MTSTNVSTPAPDPDVVVPTDVVGPAGPDAVTTRDFHHGLYREGLARWRGVVAIVCLVAGYLLLSFLFSMAAFFTDLALGTLTMEQVQAGKMPLTPLGFLAVNLTGAALIPLSMVFQRAFFGVPVRRQSSVAGPFRWRVLLRSAVVAVPLWVALMVVLSVVGYPGQPAMVWNVSVPVLAVVLLTTWAQAAGEEYGFRGLVTRAAGSWFVTPRAAFVVSTLLANLLFMAAHVASDPWLLAYYFVFGVCLSVITWRTGGLEAAVLVHTVNNVLFFLVVALFNGGEISIDRSVGAGGPFLLIPMAVDVLAAVAFTVWAGRRRTV
jgi:membrane protease YdiL (CAAX protease family)